MGGAAKPAHGQCGAARDGDRGAKHGGLGRNSGTNAATDNNVQATTITAANTAGTTNVPAATHDDPQAASLTVASTTGVIINATGAEASSAPQGTFLAATSTITTLNRMVSAP